MYYDESEQKGLTSLLEDLEEAGTGAFGEGPDSLGVPNLGSGSQASFLGVEAFRRLSGFPLTRK